MDVKVTDDPKQIGTVDVVLFAVKLWDTEAAGEQARALVGSNTRVITRALFPGISEFEGNRAARTSLCAHMQFVGQRPRVS